MHPLSRTAAAVLLALAVPATSQAGEGFAACPQFFANGRPPVVAFRPTDRALCYDAFAILHSGESKTAVFVAEKLNQASIIDADEKRTNRFFTDSRLRSAERATLERNPLTATRWKATRSWSAPGRSSIRLWLRHLVGEAMTCENGRFRSRLSFVGSIHVGAACHSVARAVGVCRAGAVRVARRLG